jgi:hypothetical protein
LIDALYRPVDISTIVGFRVIFGAIMLFEVYRYFSRDWIRQYYIVPTFHFTYFGFDWVQPWPGEGMYFHFALLGVLAACIALGIHYRLATVVFFLAYAYVFWRRRYTRTTCTSLGSSRSPWSSFRRIGRTLSMR